MEPKVSFEEQQGFHNSNPDSVTRLLRGNTYRDLSTICITPSRGLVHIRVVQNWLSMMPPMNQKFTRACMYGMEVADAYNSAITNILAHPDLSQWQYILTLEEDNMPPPDGLVRLYENIDNYDVIGGLYWTKGPEGQPMIYGDPRAVPFNFRPQPPMALLDAGAPNQIVPCCGLGMGFTLFKLSIFKDERLPKPWFKTQQEYTPYTGVKAYTQDLFFFENIHKLGYKVACDTRVRVGHYDKDNDIIW